jgi:regulatory protein
VVYLDGSRAFDVSTVVADEAGLRHGMYLDETAQEALVRADAPYRAREKALALLAVRDRCKGEIEARLRLAGFADPDIAAAARWLQGLGYVDDRRFAAAYSTARARSGWGVRRVRMELLQKGVARDVVDEVLGSEEDDTDTGRTAAVDLARRRFAGQLACDPEGAKRKLGGFLARRGYDWDEIGMIIAALEQEERGGERDEG